MTDRIILSICGPSGAGKSQLAKSLAARLGDHLCSRLPTDYYAIPATGPLPDYFAQPLRYDWALLEHVLASPEGAETSTPDFDFDYFQRLGETGGRPFTLRPVMVLDAMEPYPQSDALILLQVPDDVRHARIAARDAIWQSRVQGRLQHLDLTWTRARGLMPTPDLELNETAPLDLNAELVATWLVKRFPALAPRIGN